MPSITTKIVSSDSSYIRVLADSTRGQVCLSLDADEFTTETAHKAAARGLIDKILTRDKDMGLDTYPHPYVGPMTSRPVAADLYLHSIDL